MTFTGTAHARAGLVGNPSDGYFGKTISFIIRNFTAKVTLEEAAEFEILPTHGDLARYPSVDAFLRDQKLYGYYGGMRLMKAAVKVFHAFFRQSGTSLRSGNFTLRFESDIPRLVGLSGSSGIVVATFRGLMRFYDVEIPKHLMPGLVLSVERDELGITAGLQDRVIQTYEGLVYMDFDRALLESRGYGQYESLRPAKMPPLYVAYDAERAEISDVTHRNLKALWEKGDPGVVGAMDKLRSLVDRGRIAIESGDWDELHAVTDENYEIRRSIMPIAPENQRMIDVARSAGASAKFADSGGAICGVYHGETQFQQLTRALEQINCVVLKPLIQDNAS
jgi:glucuronokinase